MKYAVKLNGKQYEVEVEKIEEDFRALTKAEVDGEQPMPAESKARKDAAPAMAAPKKSRGAATVCSPLPGTILDVRAAVGDQVKAGQILVSIEAMKMENEIVAPVDGIVDSIPVKKGDVVDTDAVLAVLR